MISFTSPLPNALEVDGRVYNIKTDFKDWLRLIETNDYKPLFIGSIPLPTEMLMQELSSFLAGGELKKESSDSPQVVDFKHDADYIYAAFLQAYGINLINADMHWFEFLALFRALPEETAMQKIISYRQYDGKDEELKKLKSIWEIPRELTEEEKEAGDYFEEVFG